MFDGFQSRDFTVDGLKIHAVVGGNGAPLLLLHGYPQSHVCWHKVAPRLAQSFTVVAPDLRGYGDSGKPPGDKRHETYSKRRMALDQLQVMAALGFARFDVVGHDRGGRVGHRLALDHPDAVRRLVVLDIGPTREMYRRTTMQFAQAYFHWFFLTQPASLPERMIDADPEMWLRRAFLGMSAATRPDSIITPEAFAEYHRAFCDPAAIHGSCEDYRASATIDIEHDDADAGRKLACPLLVVWGAKGRLAQCYDVAAMWHERALQITARSLPGGHYLPEEFPDKLNELLLDFFSDGS